jgi:RND family efflux transporter MFP subunit
LLLFAADCGAADPAATVEVLPLSAVLVDLERSAPAEVLALNASILSAQVSAPVGAIHTDVGQSVRAGELLLELDARDYDLALRQAEANLTSLVAQKAQAEARLARARELSARQYLSADELLARETDVMVVSSQIKAQEVSVAIARRNREKCRIEAPYNAVVQERFAQLGAYVTPGSPLVQLSEIDRYELDAEVPDELAGSLPRADSIRFVSRNESWPVRLLRLSPVIGTERRSRRARFAFDGDAPAVGRSGEVVWRVERGLLPADLVVRRGDLLGVFLTRGDTAVFTPLPGAQEGRPVAVELPRDAEIVVQGRERLQDGDPIARARSSGAQSQQP